MSNLSTTADDILRCARGLIVAGGYNGFSYADIAAVVGIRKASIHHHFPGKADLVRILVTQYRQEVEVGLADLDQRVPDPIGKIRAYLEFWEACIVDQSLPFCVCALLATQIPILPEEVAQEVRAHFQMLSSWLSSVLTRGKNQGILHLTGTAEAEAEILIATVHGAMVSARAYGDPTIVSTITHPMLERLILPR